MVENERELFRKKFSVSRETLVKLDRYAELLNFWNERFNLVASSTLSHIWHRHFLDSAQLLDLIPSSSKSLADLGSGAGFPGLILNILGVHPVRLIESIGKKAAFLKTVIADLGLTAVVYQERIENIQDLSADCVTARALKPLPELLPLAQKVLAKNGTALFLKGRAVDRELTESAKCWRFDFEKKPSLSDDSGNVLIIRHLHRRYDVLSPSRRRQSKK